jgi:hypothetical protein
VRDVRRPDGQDWELLHVPRLRDEHRLELLLTTTVPGQRQGGHAAGQAITRALEL